MNVATSSARFLGYTLNQNGYTVDTDRCKIIKEYPRPRNAKDVKKFLGISTYFRRLIKNYSKRSAPLRELLTKDRQFEWTEAQERSFCDIRDQLCSAPTLGYPDRNKPLRIILDACATGLGYILVNVNPDGSETPLYYGGRSTTKAERNYSATQLELAALLTAVKTYSSYLTNCEFDIVTDHISLTYIQNLRFGPSKLVRASLLLNQYRFRITHLAGRQNSAADAISRTTNLQADPLTQHEAARFHEDSALDLCLDEGTDQDTATDDAHETDCSRRTYSDAAVQCELMAAPIDIALQTEQTPRVACTADANANVAMITATRQRNRARTHAAPSGSDSTNTPSRSVLTSAENNNNETQHTQSSIHFNDSLEHLSLIHI